MEYLSYFKKLRDKGFSPKLDLDIDVSGPKDLGIKLKASLSIDDFGTNTAVDFIEGKLLKKTEINDKVSNLILNLIESFGIKIEDDIKAKVTNIETKRAEKEENENEKILRSELTEEDMDRWTTKSSTFFSSDVTKLSSLKSKLKLKTNEELIPYINEFIGQEVNNIKAIIPRNIESFNEFLESKIDIEGGQAVWK